MTSPEGEGLVTGEGTGARGGSGPLSRAWRIRGGELSLRRPAVMGILNLTPDSFSDGGRYGDVEEALDMARAMVEQGASLIDVGGESTRPGALAVEADEELRRILPFLERGGAALGVPVSVDTRKARVARVALEAGAAVVNDVSALDYDPEMAGLVAESGAGLVLLHTRGEPAGMMAMARYGDVGSEVAAELAKAVDRARAAGVDDAALVLDPGLGFAKTAEQSTGLLADLRPVMALGHPVMVGPSRKSFLGALTGAPPEARLPGTLAACVVAYFQGARIFRVHDVGPVVQALTVAEALEAGSGRRMTEERES